MTDVLGRKVSGGSILRVAVLTVGLAGGTAAAQPCSDPEWSPLGSGVASSINDLTVYQGSLYAGGLMTSAGDAPDTLRIARWDGEAWHAVGSGLNGLVRTFLHWNGDLYVGGNFTGIQDGPASSRVARWDGTSWHPFGAGTLNGQVLAMAVFDGQLYVAGTFTTANGVTVNRIARWDGETWQPLGFGLNSSAYAMTVFDDGTGPALYVGGFFTNAGGISANRIARWNGEFWDRVHEGFNGGVLTFEIFDDGNGPALYAGGNFTEAWDVAVTSVARWTGATWAPVGTLAVDFGSFSVDTLTALNDGSGSMLYAGGTFTGADGQQVNRIARWNGASWSPLGDGVGSGQVNAIAMYDHGTGPAVYVGGTFLSAGGIPANRVARWSCPPSTGCPADFDNDGTVNTADITAFLSAWFADRAGGTLAADFDGNEVVNTADITAFLSAWFDARAGGC